MANKLKELRIKNGYTVRQFSEIIGMKPSTYSRYETGIITLDKISLSAFLKIAIAYGLTCEELFSLAKEESDET